MAKAHVGRLTDMVEAIALDAASEAASQTRNNAAFSFNGYATINRAYAANGLNQYTTAGPASFAYDGNGNLTSDGTYSYTYDAENKLVSASTSGGTTLTYDPLGRLYQTSSATYGAVQRLYDGQHVVAEYNGAGGAMLRRYYWGPGADEPIVQDEGGALNCSGTRFLHNDELGSIVATADCWGNQQAVNRYDEYGIIGSGGWGRYLYTGQAWVSDLGMLYYKARLYSPTLGRFMQTDPIGYGDGPNWYAYVHNNPVNGNDPSGLDGGDWCGSNCGDINGAGPGGGGGATDGGSSWIECEPGSPGDGSCGITVSPTDENAKFSVFLDTTGGPQGGGGDGGVGGGGGGGGQRTVSIPFTKPLVSRECTNLQARAEVVGKQLAVLAEKLGVATAGGSLTEALLIAGEAAGGLDTPATAAVGSATAFLGTGAVVTAAAAAGLQGFAAGNFTPLRLDAYNEIAGIGAKLAGNAIAQKVGLGGIGEALSALAEQALGIAEGEQQVCGGK